MTRNKVDAERGPAIAGPADIRRALLGTLEAVRPGGQGRWGQAAKQARLRKPQDLIAGQAKP